jgi:hypothetical protein
MPLRIVSGPLLQALTVNSVCRFYVASAESGTVDRVLTLKIENVYSFSQRPRPKAHLRRDELLVAGETLDGMIRVLLAVEAFTAGPVRGRFISCRSPRGYKVATALALQPAEPALTLVAL